jgi:hypothetical protein
MRARETGKTLGGSIVVYIIVAACSGAGVTGSPGPDAGVADGLTNPIADAKADVNQSGSRLKVKNYVGTDGSIVFARMHDSQLNVDCDFQNTADGTTRCIPEADTTATFSDAACTQPVLLVSDCATTIPTCVSAGILNTTTGAVVASYFSIGATTTVQALYQVTNQVMNPAASMCSGASYTGSCTAVPAATMTGLLANSKAYAVGPVIPPSMFVQATLQTDP